jgi:predicted transposase YbfD/YdcC
MLPAETFASAIRNHWAIENRNHWVRDVTLAEDASRNPDIQAPLPIMKPKHMHWRTFSRRRNLEPRGHVSRRRSPR